MFNFDLQVKPWIPARDLAGNLAEVSLREVLNNANNYLRIESENPLEVASLYRFLLAILHRALKGPTNAKDNARWFKEGFPKEAIDEYLEHFNDRFDLFHLEYPFYQIPEMPLEGYTQHWSRLSTEFGSGNTTPLFNYAKRDNAPKNPDSWITPAQAARLLLEHQTFCLGGLIKRFITSAPSGPIATAAQTLVQGDNLHQTFCLNLISYSPTEYQHDWVVWENDPPKITYLQSDPSEKPRGLVHRYAWLSRSIKLFPEEFDGQVGTRNFAYASAVRPKEFTSDALTAYRIPKKGKGDLYAFSLSKDKGLWRDFTALLPDKKNVTADITPAVIEQAIGVFGEIEQTRRPKRGLVIEVYGQMNDKGKVELWRSEARRLPKAILGQRDIRKTIENMLLQADETWGYLNTACRILAGAILAPGERKPLTEDVTRLVQTFPAKLVYWSILEQRFYEALADLDENYDETKIEQQWNNWLLEVANEAWNNTVKGTGNISRALKAAAQAQGMFYSQLKKLREKSKAITIGGNA